MPPSGAPPDAVLLGTLGRAFGLRGEVRFRPRAPRALDVLADVSEVYVDGLGACRVENLRAHGHDWVLRLGRVRGVDRARELVHARVWAARDDVPDAAAADPTLLDPSGRPVLRDGTPWGEVRSLEGTPTHPLLRVRGAGGERLLPLAAPYVRVEADAVHVIDPPAGLLEDDDS